MAKGKHFKKPAKAAKAQVETIEKPKKSVFQQVLKWVFGLVLLAVLLLNVFTYVFSVVEYNGTGMEPALQGGQTLVIRKVQKVEQGDVIAFYYNNRILVKRYIANAGDWVDIDEDGNVYVNGELLDEPYVYEKALGECNIELPYQVPENRIFVLGDHRSVSIDSRSSSVGCVAEDQIVGELVFCVWPFSNLGIIR